ncbi:hypothetical protein psyc5s11_20830 [Clostridium gelidum]|uniref:Cell wall-binding protein n=1 Tax=Clostridium gelidum TaxID=704125 RepID=A0ABM7T272_9CLOT|nr:cell wall-binding protein [Clostridium gelidum]BCZ46016.1 hypothetical protein psyc5s11_20830 [Clostridium gelidum]
MKKLKLKLTKVIASTLVVASILALNPIGASASWKQNGTGWWYTEGSSYSTGWKEIDGNWYYFYSDGYMAKDKTIDGYYLNASGAWISTQTQSEKISVVYPSNWIKKNIKGKNIYLLDDKGTSVNLVVESMQGLSEEEYNKASDIDVKTNLGIDNIKVQEHEFNNKKARLTNFVQTYQGINIPTYQVTFLNSNTSYIFTIAGREKISDENMIAFNNMLNTVKFAN